MREFRLATLIHQITGVGKSDLAANTLVYLFTSVANRTIPFLVLPVLTFYLSPASYGLLSNAQVLAELLVIFIGLNAQAYIRVHFFKLERSDLYAHLKLATIQIVCFGVAFSLLFTLLYKVLDREIFPAEFLWLPFIAACQILPMLLLTLWQCERIVKAYAILSPLMTVINFGLSLALIMAVQMDWQGRLVGILVANALGSVVAIVVFARRGVFSVPLPATSGTSAQFGYGAGLLPNALAWWARTGIDRFILVSLLNLSAVGIYTATLQISLIVLIVGESLNQAITPFLYERLAARMGALRFLVLVCLGSFVVLLLTWAMLYGISPLLYYVLDAHFHPAIPLLKVLAVGYVFHGVTLILGGVLYFYGHLRLLTSVTIAGSVIHIALAWFMTKAQGLDGIVLASPVSSIVMMSLSLAAVKWSWSRARVADGSMP